MLGYHELIISQIVRERHIIEQFIEIKEIKIKRSLRCFDNYYFHRFNFILYQQGNDDRLSFS